MPTELNPDAADTETADEKTVPSTYFHGGITWDIDIATRNCILLNMSGQAAHRAAAANAARYDHHPHKMLTMSTKMIADIIGEHGPF
jgi:hypothetical protein